MKRSSHDHVGTLVYGLVLAICVGCAQQEAVPQVVKMATTTSTANTGLLDYLMPEFEKETGIHVDFIATGTGKALKHGRDGDVDVVLVHAPPAEQEFIRDGFGTERVPIMWNDFIIAGPKDDPAQLAASTGIVDALTRLSEAQAPFVSRGDDSGTHKKEKLLWAAAGLTPAGDWYIEAGQGMGACLTMAGDKQAYVLTDRGTFLAMADKVDLEIIYAGDELLMNPYAIIAVNPEKYPDVNYAGTQRLIQWFTSPRAQSLITDFKVGGKQLFRLFDQG